MRRAATGIAGVLAFLLGAWIFVFPVQASPLTGGGGLCSICTPTGVELEAELAGGGSWSAADQTAYDSAAYAYQQAQLGTTSAATEPFGPLTGATSSVTGGTSGWSWSTLGVQALGFGLTGVLDWVLHGTSGAISALPSGTAGGGQDAAPWSTSPYTGAAPPLQITGTDNVTGVTLPAGTSADVYYISRSAVTATGHSWGASFALHAWQGDAGYAGSYFNYVRSVSSTGLNTWSNYGSSYYVAIKYFGSPSGIAFYAYASPTPTTTPDRWVEQTITCTTSGGGTVTSTVTGPVSDFSHDVNVAGLSCPSGSTASSWSAKVKTTGGSDTDLGGVTNPGASSAASLNSCATTVCSLKLQYATNATTWTDCTVGVTGPCTKWASDPNKTQDFRCEYGASSTWTVVALSSCSILSNAFQPNPTQTPYTGPTQDPTQDGCQLSWSDVLSGAVVYKAVGCALRWAFVPDAGTLQATQTSLSTSFGSSVLGQTSTVIQNVAGPFTTVPSGTSAGCQGPSVSLTWVNSAFTTPVHPIDVCSGVAKKIHDWAEPFILLLMWGAAVFSAWFFIAQAFDVSQGS